MGIGPILQRELIVLVRRKAVYKDRLISLAMVTAVILGCLWVWDWWGWDRASIGGASTFALASFGLVVVAQASVMFGLVVTQVAAAIASERDRKSLDALLATRLSAAEIVVGTLAAGLVRWVNGLAAVVPVILLMSIFEGVDPRLMLLAGVGLASTAFALGAIAVVASVCARTSRGARALACSLMLAWIYLPVLVVILKPWLWPAGPRWLVSVAIGLLSSSPIGVFANLSGLLRMGSLLQTVWWMIGWEVLGGSLLIAWASWRLRPASRGHYDDETRLAGLRILRATKWRPERPPCGDDPVFWNAIYSNRTANPIARALGRLIGLGSVGLIVLIMTWFAVPAFRELAERGYGAAPEAFHMPEVEPFARALVDLSATPIGGPSPGQARLEFNLVLRQFSAIFGFFFGFAILAGAAESVFIERDRDTWSGLIATPLSGWEIIRAKMLGALFRLRGTIVLWVGLGMVGVSAGAVHPLGFLAFLAVLIGTVGYFAALGVYLALMARDRHAALNLSVLLPFLLALCGLAIHLPGRLGVLLAASSPAFLAFTSLLSYEDIHRLIHSGVLPHYTGTTSPQPGLEARWVLASWLLGTAAYAAGALYLLRTISRKFDAAVGRPIRTGLSNRNACEVPVKLVAVSTSLEHSSGSPTP